MKMKSSILFLLKSGHSSYLYYMKWAIQLCLYKIPNWCIFTPLGDYPVLLQSLTDLHNSNALSTFKLKFLKQNTQQDQEKAEYMTNDSTLSALKNVPNAIGTEMWLRYTRQVFLTLTLDLPKPATSGKH
jgi:hypothetical protein